MWCWTGYSSSPGHGDLGGSAGHWLGAHPQYGHPVRPFLAETQPVPSRSLQTPGAVVGAHPFQRCPFLITEVSSGIVMIVFNTLILSLEGNIGVAAYGVIANLSLVVIAMFTGSPRDAAHPQPGLRAGGYQRPLFHPPLWAAHHCGAIGSYLRADGSFRPSNRLGVQQRKTTPPCKRSPPKGCGSTLLLAPLPAATWCSPYTSPPPSARGLHTPSLCCGAFFVILPLAFGLAWLGGMTGIWLAFPVTEFLVAILAAVLLIRCKQPARKS